jgi:hypothetical protein
MTGRDRGDVPRRRLLALGVTALIGLVAVAWLVVNPTPQQQASGLVTEVTSRDAATVERFSVRTDAGATLTFEVVPGRLRAGSFPPAHLREHLGGSPVRVTYASESGRLIALVLEDAPPP